MKKYKESEVLRTVFLGTFLSAFIYNPEATFKYCEGEGILEGVFEELFTLDSKMFHVYQKKLYLVGLGQLLFSDYIPDFISTHIPKILSKMILMLGRLNLAEKYKEQRLQEGRGDQEGEPNRKLKVQNLMFPENNGEDDTKIEEELKELNDFFEKESSGALLESSEDKNKPPFIIERAEKAEEDK